MFVYKAWSKAGQVSRGTVSADSPASARQHLRHQGLRVASLKPASDRPALRLRARQGTKASGLFASQRWVITIYDELATLLGAGIALLEALDAIAQQRSLGDAPRQVLMTIRDRIASGATLADAMREQGGLFDSLAVSMVQVGEKTGRLDVVLEQLAAFKRRSAQWRGRLGTAFIYPVIVVLAGAGVSLFLMTFVVPRLLAALAETGASLPLPTRIVKGASDAILSHGWIGVLVLLVLAGAASLAYRRAGVRRQLDALWLKTPVLGDLILKQQLTQFAFTLVTLTRNGVPFLDAVRIAAPAMSNRVLREALQAVSKAVGSGQDIGPAMNDAGVFPSTMVQIFAVSQATGRLDDMLERLGADYDRQVERAITRLVALLEPAMILLLSLFVGFIVLSVILPYMEAGHVL